MQDVSQGDIAELVDVDVATVNRWENDLRVPRDDAMLEKLAKVLRTTPAWLRYGEGTPPAFAVMPLAPTSISDEEERGEEK